AVEERLMPAVEERLMPLVDPFSCTQAEAIRRVREAGIIGMGGAGFPAHIKLSVPVNKPVDLIIVNAAECEPFLTCDDAAIRANPELLIQGLAAVMKITGCKRGIIGIEDNKKELIPILEQALLGQALSGQALSQWAPQAKAVPADISIVLCRTRYPQGSEKMLTTILTGRQVPSGGLPLDVGCIVQNAGTVIAIARAFYEGVPLVDRIVTVAGGACRTPKNILAPIGTRLCDLPGNFIDIDHDNLTKILFGGPMMGVSVASLDAPIQKNTSGIILMNRKEALAFEEDACIRCGRCIRACPCFLSPVIMNNSLDAGDFKYAIKAGLLDCLECGSCAYVCPARIKLVQRFRIGKQRLAMQKPAPQTPQKGTNNA
ncbi:MAG: RnfABCDGE type electron transport complex subunit C, partial [Treponema sp.]|nr:RnfABCDGE type electron transport complex subunit C [Treponema sp.]